MSNNIYLALGSNTGNRLANLRAAIHSLAPQIVVLIESRIYETEPWGYADQPAFLNMTLHAETDLPPLELLTHLKFLEKKLGRVPSFQNGPRLIDMDILFYNDLTLESSTLTVPHPRLHERAFVLVPLAEIAPTLLHPLLGRSMAALVETVDRRGVSLYGGAQSWKI